MMMEKVYHKTSKNGINPTDEKENHHDRTL